MMRSLWISKTGMEAQQLQLDTISNNLANVSTNGYKRSHAVFEDLMYQNLRQAGAASSEQTPLPTGLQVGLGTRAVATARNLSQGNLQQSSNHARRRDPRQRLLRDPDARRHHRLHPRRLVPGQLDRPAGHQQRLHRPARASPFRRQAQSVTIGNDGTVSVVLPGQALPSTVGQLQLAGFVNPAGLEPKGQNIFGETAASGTPNVGTPGQNGLGSVQQGFVETSNVNVVEELVQMIQTQRAYELNSKAIQTSDQMLQKLAQL